MLSSRLFIINFILGASTNYMVEGLQCYVCEDCNEYEDFKELHICGEIAAVTTMKPVTLPEVVGNVNNGTTTTVKSIPADPEEYIYDDSFETHDDNKDEATGSGSSAQHRRTKTKTKTEIRTTPNPTTTMKTTATTPSPSSTPLQLTEDNDYMEYDLATTGEKLNSEQTVQTKTENPTLTNTPTIFQQKPTTHSTLTDSSASSSIRTTFPTSSKPVQQTGIDDYLEYDLINSEEQNISDQSIKTENPLPSVKQQETATRSTVTSSISSKTNVPTVPTPDSSRTSLKPIELNNEYDYLEYDVSSSGKERSIQMNSKSSRASLLNMNKPVCYMIKYQVNNTMISNRGCTTLINANNYLTCQSLNNGLPMSACLFCKSDGCNKLLSDDGFIFAAAGVPDNFSVFVILLIAIICSIVV